MSADNYTSPSRNSTDTMSSHYRRTYVLVYGLLIVSMIVAILVRSAVFVSVIMVASKNLHRTMFDAIIRATMLFFNTNSSGNNNNYTLRRRVRKRAVSHVRHCCSGRIFNRFSKDMGIVDDILPLVILDFLQVSRSRSIIRCAVGADNELAVVKGAPAATSAPFIE